MLRPQERPGIDWANVGNPTTTVGPRNNDKHDPSRCECCALGTTAKSDVNAEVVDALATDTYAEPASVPSANGIA